MVIKKTKESEHLSLGSSEFRKERKALSKNNGDSVKYRIRKQEEREANDLLKEFIDEGEDLLGGSEAEVPGVDR